jgi:hypothetical protein
VKRQRWVQSRQCLHPNHPAAYPLQQTPADTRCTWAQHSTAQLLGTTGQALHDSIDQHCRGTALTRGGHTRIGRQDMSYTAGAEEYCCVLLLTYLIAAGGSSSSDPKLPWPDTCRMHVTAREQRQHNTMSCEKGPCRMLLCASMCVTAAIRKSHTHTLQNTVTRQVARATTTTKHITGAKVLTQGSCSTVLLLQLHAPGAGLARHLVSTTGTS